MASTSTAMEVEEVPKTFERERDTEIEKLLKILDIIINELGPINEKSICDYFKNKVIDIDTSDELAGVSITVFTCLRKEENDPTGHTRYKGYVTKVMETQVAILTIVEKVKKVNIKLDFKVATPIVESMTI
ncbi:unnamed protein product [Parnassius apollo]|uniref:(apollo) hypothetical protein n=1 Tax=Parnassius apollo TaxID=110799 RepID=A0A8S3W9C8_PARAO|nr:unnamed protein product [Parnassius apollo]